MERRLAAITLSNLGSMLVCCGAHALLSFLFGGFFHDRSNATVRG